MDTLQTGVFDRFYHDVGVGAAEALGALGNCEARKLHRGPVSLLMTGEVGRRDATLTVARYPAKPDDTWSTAPRNGNALDVIGGLNMQGPLIGGFFWGMALDDWHDFNLDVGGNRNAWRSWVDIEVVQDHLGTACPVARTVRVYLPRTPTGDPNVRLGEIFPFMLGRNGVAYCTGDVIDGKIGETRDLGLDEDPADYSSGLRGWYPADGTNGTDDLSGPLVLYGYTGAGDYATVGASVASAFAATIATSALSVGSATTGISVSTHSSQSCNVTDPGHFHTTSFTGNDGTVTAGTVDMNYASSINTDSKATGITVTTPVLAHVVNDSGHTHSGTISTLTFDAPSSNRPPGRVILRIQRVD